MSPKTCWVVCDDGKVGTEHQCVGLAGNLGFNPEIIRLTAKGIWEYLPPRLWFKPLSGIKTQKGLLTEPWPNLIIAAGRLSVAPTAYIRKITQGRTKVVQLQNPRVTPAFDKIYINIEHQ